MIRRTFQAKDRPTTPWGHHQHHRCHKYRQLHNHQRRGPWG
ncbi:unnamed protein product [Ectocarpus sp. 12 AP-2014]